MKAEIYWIPEVQRGRLGIMPRPSGGDWLRQEVELWQDERVDALVCLLEPAEARALELDEEGSICADCGIEFISFPIRDHSVPTSPQQVTYLADRIVALLDGGATVAIHCYAGIGRSSLIAACVLFRLGFAPERVFEIISRARGLRVPETAEQARWFAAWVEGAR